MSDERTRHTSHFGTTEIRVTGGRGGVVLNVGGQHVSLSRNEAGRLGRDLIERANRQPSVEDLFQAMIAQGESDAFFLPVEELYAEALS